MIIMIIHITTSIRKQKNKKKTSSIYLRSQIRNQIYIQSIYRWQTAESVSVNNVWYKLHDGRRRTMNNEEFINKIIYSLM